jgi:hypothetical protein
MARQMVHRRGGRDELSLAQSYISVLPGQSREDLAALRLDHDFHLL